MLRRNVLIFHAGALGDFILSWPLAMAAGRLYPQSRVICVCAHQKGKLLERALRLESVDVEAGFGSLFAENAQPPENVQKCLAVAHTIFSFVASADSTWAKNVAKFAGDATTVFIDPVLPADYPRHASDHLVEQLAGAPVIATAVQQMLRSIAERGLGLQADPSGPVVIHPGAGSNSKCWPMDRYREVATRLQASGRTVQWIAGEVEVERWPASDLTGFKIPKTLVELFDILKTASLFIGNDSGPSHLAGMMGLPTIALFAPTSPNQWKPLGPQVKTLSQTISTDDVIAQL